MNENCLTCHSDYVVTPDNARLVLFISYPPANHVRATCGCGAVEIIYLTPFAIMKLMTMGKFNLILDDEPSPERRQAADITWGKFVAPKESDELPQPPREWLRQLHDDLREFGSRS